MRISDGQLPLGWGLSAHIHGVAQIKEVTTLTPELVTAAQESLVICTLVNHVIPKNYDA